MKKSLAMKVKELAKMTGGSLLSGNPGLCIDPGRISTDSRNIKRGGFFIAVSGPNFNGNDFVEDAFSKGAVGAIAERYKASAIPRGKVLIKVDDALEAFHSIAYYYRRQFDIPVICVTGSNGKTTVKEMIWHVLSKKYRVLKNEGTKNNHIGVPQTILKLDRKHEICVLELGANHKGEIAALARIAGPNVVVMTNIGPSHLEFFRDLNGVFSAKKEILGHLDKKGGIVALNGDDRFLSKIKSGKFKIVKFGLSISNDFFAGNVSIEKNSIKFRLNGKEDFDLRIFGIHNVYNALAAIAVCSRFKVSRSSMKKSLHDFRPSYMRLCLERVGGIDVINDSYNSNPLSMNQALEVIKQYPARRRWVVSGDMLELGDKGADFHRAVGERIAVSNIEGLITLGELSKHTLSQAKDSGMAGEKLWHCATHSEAAGILRRVADKGDVILLKGSRSMKMEEVLNKFKSR